MCTFLHIYSFVLPVCIAVLLEMHWKVRFHAYVAGNPVGSKKLKLLKGQNIAQKCTPAFQFSTFLAILLIQPSYVNN
jgi:hypothetical protein